MKLPAELRQTAGVMCAELEGTQLRVALAACQHGGRNRKIRVVEQRNPDWYRRFCLAYPSSRRRRRKKPDTLIKRAATLRGLRELEQGEMESVYAIRLFSVVVDEYLSNWQPAELFEAKSSRAEVPQPIFL